MDDVFEKVNKTVSIEIYRLRAKTEYKINLYVMEKKVLKHAASTKFTTVGSFHESLSSEDTLRVLKRNDVLKYEVFIAFITNSISVKHDDRNIHICIDCICMTGILLSLLKKFFLSLLQARGSGSLTTVPWLKWREYRLLLF